MKNKDANYDFKKQKAPPRPMGHGSFANMPVSPIVQSFADAHDYRDGIVNSFTTHLEEMSHVDENQR
jgi:hypothetical protein